MKKLTILIPFIFSAFFTSVHAGEVNRAQFTSNISDREPVDELVSVPVEMQKISYFTELLNFKGEKITHQWTYNDKEMYSLSFDVNGPRWRVWSSKRMLPRWNGSWTVNILDSNGQIIKSDSFIYMP